MKLLFLDESGDHSLDKIDPSYPIFVLGGVILDRSYARDVVTPRMRQLKLEFFGRDDIILHTADIIRPKKGFEILKDERIRTHFYQSLNEMMKDLEYKVIACAIKKNEHLEKYGDRADDPYMYSLKVLVERFCHEIGDIEDGGIIYAEKRGEELDLQLERAWIDLQLRGTTYAPSHRINKRIVDLSIRHKCLNIAGLQLADLVISPIGRALIGKPRHEDWDIVESKFRRRTINGSYHGCGLVVLPSR